MNYYLLGAALLHAVFMVAELFPWSYPVLLDTVSKKALAGDRPFTKAQQEMVATIVHNAGIYNAILAGGLFWAAFGCAGSTETARVLLTGAMAAGVFGAVTMKSPIPGVQAVVGLLCLFKV